MRALATLALLGCLAGPSLAQVPGPGTMLSTAPHRFAVTVERLEAAIAEEKMLVVAKASASAGAAGRGITIAGNAVLMVFRNDYAVRMLAASIPAGFEAPLRLHVTEEPGGTTTIRWRLPSAVFAPYGSGELDTMARELDAVFQRIVGRAVATQ